MPGNVRIEIGYSGVRHEVGQRCFQQRWQVGGWDQQKGQCGDQERR